jgi:hypothetical protein
VSEKELGVENERKRDMGDSELSGKGGMEAGGSNLFQMMLSLMYIVLSYVYSEVQVFRLYAI